MNRRRMIDKTVRLINEMEAEFDTTDWRKEMYVGFFALDAAINYLKQALIHLEPALRDANVTQLRDYITNYDLPELASQDDPQT